MAEPSPALVLLYASLARSPDFLLGLASRMAASAFERHDMDGVDRWTRCCHELSHPPDDEEAEGGTAIW